MSKDFGCTLNKFEAQTGKYSLDCTSGDQNLQYDCSLKMVDMGDKVRYVTQCTDNNDVSAMEYCTLSSIGLDNGKIQYDTQCTKF